MKYEAVIGLEVHAQIHTRSKMYCACPVVADTGDVPPNTQVCPVCLALPGTLPVVNRRAVELGIMTGLALGCTINPVNVFARKSYFYPDLPKGYQISQYELPLAVNGALEIETEAGVQRIGITRAHLEEDTAKLYHQDDGSALVDFNRAGVPLIEIVSEPDLRTVEAVQAYATTLRDVLIYLGINAGDMEKGEMRFEANVSIRPVGATTLGTRTEIKNLNSFRALALSVAYEIERQKAALTNGETVNQQTLGWDEAAGRTYAQRSKEYAHDYRYFPEPDIPPLEIAPDWIEALGARVPELPQAKKAPVDGRVRHPPIRRGAVGERPARRRLFRDRRRGRARAGYRATGRCQLGRRGTVPHLECHRHPDRRLQGDAGAPGGSARAGAARRSQRDGGKDGARRDVRDGRSARRCRPPIGIDADLGRRRAHRAH